MCQKVFLSVRQTMPILSEMVGKIFGYPENKRHYNAVKYVQIYVLLNLNEMCRLPVLFCIITDCNYQATK